MDKVDFWRHCVSHHSQDPNRQWRALFEFWAIEHDCLFVEVGNDGVKKDQVEAMDGA
jgi:hypothetical protein